MLTYIDPKEIHQRKDVDLLTRYMKSCFMNEENKHDSTLMGGCIVG
jgi:hypothetical protein